MLMRKLFAGAVKLGVELSAEQLEKFEIYYRELIRWNKKLNLTTITDYEEVQVKHFLDSLTVLLALREDKVENPTLNIIDIGTGAGFPGVPLKILFIKPRVVLVDSKSKKADFLRYIVRKLDLDNIEVVVGRAEEIGHLPLYRQQFALAVSRAVAPLPALVELALPFCQVGGKFVAWKKGEISLETNRANKAIETLGGKLKQVKKVELEEFSDERYLIIIDKIYPTPDKYPRRPGIPVRRPI